MEDGAEAGGQVDGQGGDGEAPLGGGGGWPGGWKGDPTGDDEEEEEDGEEDTIDLRMCHKCHKKGYLRKGTCANRHCVPKTKKGQGKGGRGGRKAV